MRPLLAVPALLAFASVLGAQPRPKVHIVATGGTIASTNYYSDQVGKVGVEALLRLVPRIDSVAVLSAQQFSNVASTAIGPTEWLALSRAIGDTLRTRPDLSGIVVTHGTDTMEETAWFLDLTVADARPIVVTGAMRPADGIGIDGPANLYNAVRVAGDSAARRRGTFVLLNDEIFAARDVVKTNTVRTNAFAAPYRGALGVADPERVVFHRPAVRSPTFDVAGLRELPRVDIAYVYGGADGAAIDAFVAAGAKGIVVAGAGRGSLTQGVGDAVRRAVGQGVVVVIGSRTGSGSVPVGSGMRRGSPSALGAGDLTVQKARVLLMLALTRTSSSADIARIFQDHQ